MRRIINGLARWAAVGCLVAIALAARADDALYYRGYFSGRAVEVPPQGFVYQVDPNTFQPAWYYQYGMRPVPLNPGAPGRAGTERRAPQVRAPFMPVGPTVLISPVPLPGQYWYSEPGAYALRNHDLGWPYDNRR